jgi:hypothetical protein
MEEITDAEVSHALGMIEELLQTHLEDLRVIRENAAVRPTAEPAVGSDAGRVQGEDDGDRDGGRNLDETPIPSQHRGRSPSPPQEYHGMYS